MGTVGKVRQSWECGGAEEQSSPRSSGEWKTGGIFRVETHLHEISNRSRREAGFISKNDFQAAFYSLVSGLSSGLGCLRGMLGVGGGVTGE